METILSSRSLLKFWMDDDKLIEGLTRMQKPLPELIRGKRKCHHLTRFSRSFQHLAQNKSLAGNKTGNFGL